MPKSAAILEIGLPLLETAPDGPAIKMAQKTLLDFVRSEKIIAIEKLNELAAAGTDASVPCQLNTAVRLGDRLDAKTVLVLTTEQIHDLRR